MITPRQLAENELNRASTQRNVEQERIHRTLGNIVGVAISEGKLTSRGGVAVYQELKSDPLLHSTSPSNHETLFEDTYNIDLALKYFGEHGWDAIYSGETKVIYPRGGDVQTEDTWLIHTFKLTPQ